MAEDPFASIAEPAAAPGGADPFASIAEPAAQTQQEPQTPGFFKRLTAPYNPDAEDRNPVIRTLDAAGGALLSTPGAVYHAFADKPTEEENKKYGGDTGGLKRVGLGLERLVVDPVEGAAKDYASGKVTPEGALSVLPEAIGVGIGSQAAGELGGRGLSKVGELRTQFKDSMGGGKLQPFARKFTNVESALKDEVTDAADKHAGAMEKNKEARRDVFKENMKKQADANFDIGREKVRIAEKNKVIEAENKAAQEQVAKRETAEKLVDKQSVNLREQLVQLEDEAHKVADSKFDAVKKKVGNPETNPAPLTAAVDLAEKEDLQGIPENIKEFRAITGLGKDVAEDAGLQDAAMRHAGDEGQLGEDAAAALEGPKPATWDFLQSVKSRIDARIRQHFRGQRLNGDVLHALYRVQGQVVETMGDMAEEAGAHALWTDAKKTWREYKQDFHEPTGKEGSGSPVARALNAVDPAKIRNSFLGSAQSTLGNRGAEILRKYAQHGGNNAAALVEQLVKDHDTMKSLPKKVTPKALKEPSQVHDMPARKPAPPVPDQPTVDAQKVAREAIAKQARNWGSFNARDVGILASGGLGEIIGGIFGGSPMERVAGAVTGVGMYEGGKYLGSRILNKPSVIDWLSKTPPEELAALNKIPGADKVKIVNAITNQAIKAGKPVKLSPAAVQLIGPANVARIAAATGSVAATRVQNRKDAMELLGQ